MPTLLGRLAVLVARRRRVAALGCVALIVALFVVAGARGTSFSDDFRVSGSESQRASDVLSRSFDEQGGGVATVVLATRRGTLTDDRAARAVRAAVVRLRELPGVVQVADPLRTPGLLAEGRRVAFTDVVHREAADDLGPEAYDRVVAALRPLERAGVRHALRGDVVDVAQPVVPIAGEVAGAAVAAVLLTVLLRSVVGMALTLAVALGGLAAGFGLLGLAGTFTTLPSLAETLGLMLGLGVGIDYALFLVARLRERRAAGDDVLAAVRAMHRTAGEAVLTAGTIVVVALCGLLASGVRDIGLLGVGLAVVVAGVAAGTLVLAPALLSGRGRALRPRSADAARPGGRLLAAWARLVLRQPRTAAALGLAVLVVLAVPVADLRVGVPDDANRSTDSTLRQSYDLLAEGFGPGANGPLVVALSTPRDGEAVTARVARELRATPGVADVPAPERSADGRTAAITVVPSTGPQDEATSRLVERLRTRVLPEVTEGTGARAAVGGQTALDDDLSARVAERLPVLVGAVVVASVVVLALLLRSPLVALVSAAFNLLGVLAAYGMVVAAFGWGWLSDAFGLASDAPLPPALVLLLFVILFGLSMDYNVFLQSRIREHHLESGDARESVVDGMAGAGGVVLAAGAIIVAVFCGFATASDPTVKMTAAGLAAAIALDVLVVRLVLVPAVTALLGDRAWPRSRRSAAARRAVAVHARG